MGGGDHRELAALENRHSFFQKRSPGLVGVFRTVENAPGVGRQDHGIFQTTVQGSAHDALAYPLHHGRGADNPVA